MTTVNFGTTEQATAVTSLAPSLAMPPVLVLPADHEAGDVLQEHQRDAALVAQLDEVRALERRLAEQDAVVGDDARPGSPRCCAKPQTRVSPYSSLNSWNRLPSTIRRITSRTSYGVRVSVGTTS